MPGFFVYVLCLVLILNLCHCEEERVGNLVACTSRPVPALISALANIKRLY